MGRDYTPDEEKSVQTLTVPEIQRMLEKKRRKSPRQNPQAVFRAVLKLLPKDEMRSDLASEYVLRRDFYDRIKVPQNSVCQDNLIRHTEWFGILCSMLFAADDDEAAAAFTKIVAEHYANHMSKELHIMKERLKEHPEDEERLQNIFVDSFSYHLRDIILYIEEFLDYDVFVEAARAAFVACDAQEGRKHPSKGLVSELVTEMTEMIKSDWGAYSTDEYIERNIFLASYRNDSKFYAACKETVLKLLQKQSALDALYSLPKSGKRLNAAHSLWVEHTDFGNITLSDIENIDSALRADPSEGFSSEDALDAGFKLPVQLSTFLEMMLTRLVCSEDESRKAPYEKSLWLRRDAKFVKDIVNRTFLMAEQCGMKTDDSMSAAERQFILVNIVQEIVKASLYLQGHELTDALIRAEKGRNDFVIKESKKYASERFEQLLADNRRLQSEHSEQTAPEQPKNMLSKEDAKEIRAQIAEKSRKLSFMEEEVRRLKAENEELFALLQDEDEPLSKADGEQDVQKALKGKRILVWGCRGDFCRKFDGKYKNITMIDTSARCVSKLSMAQLSVYDGVIIHTNSCSHSMYSGVISNVKGNGLPYIHMRKADNSDAVFRQSIIALCRKIDSEKAERKEKQNGNI